jgi:hypothetical protein
VNDAVHIVVGPEPATHRRTLRGGAGSGRGAAAALWPT